MSKASIYCSEIVLYDGPGSQLRGNEAFPGATQLLKKGELSSKLKLKTIKQQPLFNRERCRPASLSASWLQMSLQRALHWGLAEPQGGRSLDPWIATWRRAASYEEYSFQTSCVQKANFYSV